MTNDSTLISIIKNMWDLGFIVFLVILLIIPYILSKKSTLKFSFSRIACITFFDFLLGTLYLSFIPFILYPLWIDILCPLTFSSWNDCSSKKANIYLYILGFLVAIIFISFLRVLTSKILQDKGKYCKYSTLWLILIFLISILINFLYYFTRIF